MTMLPTPEPSRASGDCEDGPSVNPQPASDETSDDTLRDFLHSVNEHNNVTNEQSNQPSEQPNATPNDLFQDSNGGQPPSTADDQQSRKRAAEEELTGQTKRTGPTGRAAYTFADVSSFFSCFNIEGATAAEPRTYKETNVREEAVDELIDEAPVHQKDISKAEIRRCLGSLSLRIKPIVEDNDRRWIVKGLTTPLRTYQALGSGRIRMLEKMLEMYIALRSLDGTTPGLPQNVNGYSGGILADQMGLGKTLQMLTAIHDGHSHKSTKDGTTLIVSSASLTTHVWHDQIMQHFDAQSFGKVAVYKGLKHHKTSGMMELSEIVEMFRTSTVILTTWYVVREAFKTTPEYSESGKENGQKRHNALGVDPLHTFDWLRVVLDECTMMKTHTTQTAKACFALKGQFRWLISGTLIHDNLDEMYSYFNFLKMPAMDEKKEFTKQFIIKRGKARMANPALSEQVKDLMIRRTAKSTIAGAPILVLPPVSYYEIPVACLPHEQRLHDNLAKEVAFIIRNILRELKAGRMKKPEAKKRIVVQLTRRRLATGHFWLIAAELQGLLAVRKEEALFMKLNNQEAFEAFIKECVDDPRTMADDQMLARTCKVLQEWQVRRDPKSNKKIRFPVWTFLEYHCLLLSAKIRAVKQKLREWMADNPSRKIIVFSVFIAEINIIHHICKTMGWGARTYHGGMSATSRENTLKKWRDEPEINILLSSLGAGGMGLNLVHASRCLIVDLHWNAALEEQAMARIYRLGQTKKTEIARITVHGTFDDNLLNKQLAKSTNIACVMNGKAFIKNTSLADLLLLNGWTEDEVKGLDDDKPRRTNEDDDFIDDADVEEEDADEVDDDEYVPKKRSKKTKSKSKAKTRSKTPTLFVDSDDDDDDDSTADGSKSKAGSESGLAGESEASGGINDEDLNDEEVDFGMDDEEIGNHFTNLSEDFTGISGLKCKV